MARVTLKPGHVQPVWAGHPWVFAQAVERVEGGAAPGDEVDVVDPTGKFLGRGFYSPSSAILVRLHSRTPGSRFDAKLVQNRVLAAQERRRRFDLPSPDTTGYRLIHGEGDDLPGLVVDCFEDTLCVQFGTVGMKRHASIILDALSAATHARAILDRSSNKAAKLEGFDASRAALRGSPVSQLKFRERGLSFSVPAELTQKTGYYFDQRPLRRRIEQLAPGHRVLDAYTYVGSVALSAARGGATEVLAIDSSAQALKVAGECCLMNGLTDRVRFQRASARDALKAAGRAGGFDLVVCDPPKLSPTRTTRSRALAAMRQLAAAGSRATVPGGVLVISSCSAAVTLADLTRTLALGVRDVGMRATVVERLFQGPDHPVVAAFAEGLYLSTVIAEIQLI